MVPISSANPELSEQNRHILFEVARSSIRHGLETGRPLLPDISEYPGELTQTRSSFVTIRIREQLRGCIGSLEATQPLVVDVAFHAHGAAFRDPRFGSLQPHELEQLHINISILSQPERMTFSSEADLLSQIKPGVDGLIISEERARGTFLPAVWEHLPNPTDFLRQLKMKAGLSPDYWSDTLVIERYTTESFSE